MADAYQPKQKIGSKRLVVGAHYGLRDWLLQRLVETRMYGDRADPIRAATAFAAS